MAIHIERIWFSALGCIFNNDAGSKISRFVRNMPAYKSVLSGFKIKIRRADFTTKHNEHAHHLIIEYRASLTTVPIPEYLDLSERSPLKIHVLVHLDF